MVNSLIMELEGSAQGRLYELTEKLKSISRQSRSGPTQTAVFLQTDLKAAEISSLSNLTEQVVLCGCECENWNEVAERLAEMPALLKIDANHCDISLEAYSKLAYSKSLSELALGIVTVTQKIAGYQIK